MAGQNVAQKLLSTNNVIRLLRENNFRFSKNWRLVAAELNVPLEERSQQEHQLSALIEADFSHYLEESIDHWLRNSDEPSWEKLLRIIAKCDRNTAKNMGLYLGISQGILHSKSIDSEVTEVTHTTTVPVLMAIPTTYTVLLPPSTIPVKPSESTIDTFPSSTSNVSTVSSLSNPPSEIVTRQASEDNPELVELLKEMTIEDPQQIEIACKVINADTNKLIQSTNAPLTRDITIVRRPPRLQEFSSDSVKVGTAIRLEITADCDCYLYIINIGTSGKTSMLLPNSYDPSNYFKANQIYYLPGEDFGFEIDGPSGKETIQMMAFSQRETSLDNLSGCSVHTKELYRDISIKRKVNVPSLKKGFAQVQFEVQV